MFEQYIELSNILDPNMPFLMNVPVPYQLMLKAQSMKQLKIWASH